MRRAAIRTKFVKALTAAGWLAALIRRNMVDRPRASASSIIMEEINRAGGNSGACHGQMYNMSRIPAPGSDEQKNLYLRRSPAANCACRSTAVTEPTTGSDTTKLQDDRREEGRPLCRSTARRCGRRALQHSDLMVLLARTTPMDQVKEASEGLSVFLVDMRDAIERHDREADRQHGESRDQRVLLRRLEQSRRENLIGRKAAASATFLKASTPSAL